MPTGYCVKCKTKREMKDAKEVTMKNGRKAIKGKCSVCGTGMYSILPGKKGGADNSAADLDISNDFGVDGGCGCDGAAEEPFVGGAQRRRRSRRSKKSLQEAGSKGGRRSRRSKKSRGSKKSRSKKSRSSRRSRRSSRR